MKPLIYILFSFALLFLISCATKTIVSKNQKLQIIPDLNKFSKISILQNKIAEIDTEILTKETQVKKYENSSLEDYPFQLRQVQIEIQNLKSRKQQAELELNQINSL